MMDCSGCLVPGNLDLGCQLFIGIVWDLETEGMVQSSWKEIKSHGKLSLGITHSSDRRFQLAFCLQLSMSSQNHFQTNVVFVLRYSI